MDGRGRPTIVIIGAGFAGLWAARHLRNADADVILIDRNNYHMFVPLLYQVAAAEVEPEAIVYPIRIIMRKSHNSRFVLGDVRRIDLENRVVTTQEISIPYDYMIVATGSASNFFGIPGARQNSFPLKTLQEGAGLRSQIISCFERAAIEPDESVRRRLLCFAVIGGGPTGVEFAGALSELIRGPLLHDYPTLDFSEVRVVLLEATDRLLTGLPLNLADYAIRRLERMGVEVRLQAAVDSVGEDSIRLKNGEEMVTETVVWTAGVRGDPNAELWGLPTLRNGRVNVLPTLQVSGHPEAYVIGDLAHLEQNGKPLPMVAPVAIQQAKSAADNIRRQMRGEDGLGFHYRDKGTLATIGRNKAVAYIWGRTLTGMPAWLLWVIVHIYQLIGFRNRALVLLSWAWDYLFFEKTVRLILPAGDRTDLRSSSSQ